MMRASDKRKIRTMYSIGIQIEEIARIFKVTPNQILMIVGHKK